MEAKLVHLKMKPSLNQKGIGIVEVIAALGLSILVLTSLVSLSLFSVRSSLQSKLLLEGTKQANKQLELVRAFRDSRSEWENGSNGFLDLIMGCTGEASTGGICYMDDSSTELSVQSGNEPLRIRPGTAEEIVVSFITYHPDTENQLVSGNEEVRVAVEVSWTIADETKYARLYTDLTNWANR
jgi:hypothetical protein